MITRQNVIFDKLTRSLQDLSRMGSIHPHEFVELIRLVQDWCEENEEKHPQELTTMDCDELSSKSLHFKE